MARSRGSCGWRDLVSLNMELKDQSYLTMASSIWAIFILTLLSVSSLTRALVPATETFSYVNEGEFGDYIVEYSANYRVLDVFNSPFQLCFYNTTPGAYTLALRMGTRRSESRRRWVWEANRGVPVDENATFALLPSGDLVLSKSNGDKVWSSGTSGADVVAFRLLSTGNMVLLDSKGKFVWQSFDYPTDTLLPGQSLRLKGPNNRLVSRLSEKENKNGAYRMELETKKFALYYTSPRASKPMLYYDSTDFLSVGNKPINELTFTSEPETDDAFAFELRLGTGAGGYRILSRPKYNASLTYLRLGIDGGLRAFTFYDKVDYQAWEETFTLFPRRSGEECQIPKRCGEFGLCEDRQCVACPSRTGLLGWSNKCSPPKLTSCNNVAYFRLEGVDHFLSKYTRGTPLKEDQCMNKCSSDCKCTAAFFNSAESRCWLIYDLKTLTRVNNSTHLGYIKYSISIGG